jgi:uncharacterized protein
MSNDFNHMLSAALLGDLDAQVALGMAYYTGNLFVLKDIEKAVYWYAIAADNGSAIAKYFLADLYERGIGVAIDTIKAFKYIQSAAQASFQPAKLALVAYYENGIGVEKSIYKAKEILIALANSNNAYAATSLGIRFATEGFYGPKDNEAALHWWNLAIDFGDAKACFFLGGYYKENGDFEKSIAMYELAANRGNKNACLVLSVLYPHGTGGAELNLDKAKEYSEKAKLYRDEFVEFSLNSIRP